MNKMTLQQLIDNYYVPHIDASLQDDKLMAEYKTQTSVLTQLSHLTSILHKYSINENDIRLITQEYTEHVIPAGTKSVVRGEKFNYIVKEHLSSLGCLQSTDLELCFETRHPDFPTDEVPDFYIYQPRAKKCLIGMNQIDFWTGGHQYNRASKYILSPPQTNFQLLSVICRHATPSPGSKLFRIFEKGLRQGTLCYVSQLETIICRFFNVHTTGTKRVPIDKFYTKPSIAHECVQDFASHLSIGERDCVIEPSAGAGAFLSALQPYHKFAYDILPDHPSIQQQDFLLLDSTSFVQFDHVYVIGNPPFGANSCLAKKFIRKACSFCDAFGFILPKSFKKSSFQQSVPSMFHLVLEKDLPAYSFELDEVDYNVPCVFQIWERRAHQRPSSQKVPPASFYSFVTREHAQIALRRVGVNAGKCYTTNLNDKSPSSHYFLTLHGCSVQDFVQEYSKLHFASAGHTVGPKSISKQEFIVQLNLMKL